MSISSDFLLYIHTTWWIKLHSSTLTILYGSSLLYTRARVTMVYYSSGGNTRRSTIHCLVYCASVTTNSTTKLGACEASRFDSKVMGRFENFRIGRACPLLVVVKRLNPLTVLSRTVDSLALWVIIRRYCLMCSRIGMRNL